MALSGNYIKATYVASETEVNTYTVTYPEVLLDTDPDYEKRGTTAELSEPVMVKQEEILSDVYLIITGVTIEKVNVDSNNIGYSYRVYNNQQERADDVNNYLVDGRDYFIWDDDSAVNPFVRCYEHLKTKEECVNLINS